MPSGATGSAGDSESQGCRFETYLGIQMGLKTKRKSRLSV